MLYYYLEQFIGCILNEMEIKSIHTFSFWKINALVSFSGNNNESFTQMFQSFICNFVMQEATSTCKVIQVFIWIDYTTLKLIIF